VRSCHLSSVRAWAYAGVITVLGCGRVSIGDYGHSGKPQAGASGATGHATVETGGTSSTVHSGGAAAATDDPAGGIAGDAGESASSGGDGGGVNSAGAAAGMDAIAAGHAGQFSGARGGGGSLPGPGSGGAAVASTGGAATAGGVAGAAGAAGTTEPSAAAGAGGVAGAAGAPSQGAQAGFPAAGGAAGVEQVGGEGGVASPSTTGGASGRGGGAGAPPNGGEGGVAGSAGSGGDAVVLPEVAWEPCTAGSAVTTVAPSTEGDCWVGCANGDIFYGPCTGDDWRLSNDTTRPGAAPRVPVGPVSSIVSLHNDSQHAYAAFVGPEAAPRVWETTDQGGSWSELVNSTEQDVWALSYNPIDTLRLYAYTVSADGGNAYVDRSLDGGQSFSLMYMPDSLFELPSGGLDLVTTVSLYGADPDHFIVGTVLGHLYIAVDATSEITWGRIGSVDLPQRHVTKIALRQRDTLEFWVTFAGQPRTSVWVSKDAGMNWETVSAPGLPTGPATITPEGWYGVSFNPVFPETLYLFGSEGAYRTVNGGESWVRVWRG
jgi:hypothetical protein